MNYCEGTLRVWFEWLLDACKVFLIDSCGCGSSARWQNRHNLPVLEKIELVYSLYYPSFQIFEVVIAVEFKFLELLSAFRWFRLDHENISAGGRYDTATEAHFFPRSFESNLSGNQNLLASGSLLWLLVFISN